MKRERDPAQLCLLFAGLFLLSPVFSHSSGSRFPFSSLVSPPIARSLLNLFCCFSFISPFSFRSFSCPSHVVAFTFPFCFLTVYTVHTLIVNSSIPLFLSLLFLPFCSSVRFLHILTPPVTYLPLLAPSFHSFYPGSSDFVSDPGSAARLPALRPGAVGSSPPQPFRTHLSPAAPGNEQERDP